jgi:hypothetical protein
MINNTATMERRFFIGGQSGTNQIEMQLHCVSDRRRAAQGSRH